MKMQLHISYGSWAVKTSKKGFFWSYYNRLVVRCKTENAKEKLVTEIVFDTG